MKQVFILIFMKLHSDFTRKVFWCFLFRLGQIPTICDTGNTHLYKIPP